MIFVSIFCLSCFFALNFFFFLKGDSSEWTIYYFETCIIYPFGCNFKGDLVWCSFPVCEILLLQCGLGSKLISGIWIPGGWKDLTSLSFWKLNSMGIQRQEQDMGHIEEGQLKTAALGSESGDKMEKGYRDILEGHVKMGLRCLLLVWLDANKHFCCKRWSRRTWGKLKRNNFYKTSY